MPASQSTNAPSQLHNTRPVVGLDLYIGENAGAAAATAHVSAHVSGHAACRPQAARDLGLVSWSLLKMRRVCTVHTPTASTVCVPLPCVRASLPLLCVPLCPPRSPRSPCQAPASPRHTVPPPRQPSAFPRQLQEAARQPGRQPPPRQPRAAVPCRCDICWRCVANNTRAPRASRGPRKLRCGPSRHNAGDNRLTSIDAGA